MARFINLVGERLVFVDMREGLISIRQPVVYDGKSDINVDNETGDTKLANGRQSNMDTMRK
jgi:hypothetical protein